MLPNRWASSFNLIEKKNTQKNITNPKETCLALLIYLLLVSLLVISRNKKDKKTKYKYINITNL